MVGTAVPTALAGSIKMSKTVIPVRHAAKDSTQRTAALHASRVSKASSKSYLMPQSTHASFVQQEARL